jgi:hypothetical protein
MGRQMRESSAVQARAEAVRLRGAQRQRQPRRPDGGQQPTRGADDQRPHETLRQQAPRHPEVEDYLGECNVLKLRVGSEAPSH